jgi:Concanavalin A-like lectin/glucanases superfamily/Domain of unknown function (DUF2341)
MNRKIILETMNTAVSVLCLLISTMAPRCTRMVAGGGSEAGNGIVSGCITDESGKPAGSTIVMAVPKGYNSVMDNPLPDSSITATDSNGNYQCKVPRAGMYNILAVSMNSGQRSLIQDIVVGSAESPKVPVGILERPGRIRVTLLDSGDVQYGYFYIPGTTVATSLTGAKGYALLDSVPAALILSVNYGVRIGEDLPRSIRDSVTVTPGATVTILFSSWKHSRNLYLNTTASGADVATSVHRFPVLVRLTENNFQFDQAKADGRDVRFVKSDNTPISFEIASWDSAKAQAELWVAVDTVYGYDSTHYITMLWGASTNSVTSLSNSAAVFDTTAGFEAVWHFDGNCNDATYHRRNGTSFGASDTVGAIGSAMKFHGTDSVRVSGLMDSLQTITLSAWAELDAPGLAGAEIASIGDNVVLRMDDVRPTGPSGTMGAMHYSTDTIWSNVYSAKLLAQTGWHHLAFCCDAVTNHVQSLYIDGVLCGVQTNAGPISYAGLGTNTLIGKHGDGKNVYGFTGRIDEVRVCNEMRSADWVKLCYMNQKQNDALVVIK